MSAQSGELVSLPAFPKTGRAVLLFPDGAYRANLYVYDPYGAIDWYALVPQSFTNGRTFTMGRGADCNIALSDGSVSTKHACLTAVSGKIVLRDLHSTNGTMLNGETVEEVVLQHGDVIRVGGTDIRFLYSYRDSPVNLVLDFQAGPNTGKSVATFGASTNIGRLNCAINLQGAEVAAQHVRIDAFGRELLFVANLNRENKTWLNGEPVRGLAPAREGDILRVGQHEIALRVADPDELLDAVAQGDGTLLVTPRGGVNAPVAQVSAEDLARMEAHLQDLGPNTGSDDTAFDLQGPALLRSSGPRAVLDPVQMTLERPIPQPPPPPRGGMLRAALLMTLGVLLVGAVATGALVKIPQYTLISGVTIAGIEKPVVSTARGRVESVYFRAGDTVKADDVLLTLTDLEVRTEVDELDQRLDALRKAEKPTVKHVTGKAPAALRSQLSRAEATADSARARARSILDAFNRREVGFKDLEAARQAETIAHRTVYKLRAAIEEARTSRKIKVGGPTTSTTAEISTLSARRDALMGKLRVQVKAGTGGQLVAVTGMAPKAGVAVLAGQQLFNVVDTRQIGVRLNVPYDLLPLTESQALSVKIGTESRVIEFGKAGQIAAEDGQFPLQVLVANPDGALRVGAPVTTEIEHGQKSGLGWLWARITR